MIAAYGDGRPLNGRFSWTRTRREHGHGRSAEPGDAAAKNQDRALEKL